MDTARHGAFVTSAELFDHGRFAISRSEANAMDPQQRLLLESSYAALRSSNRDMAALSGSGTGVALGIYATEFAQLLAGSPLGRSVYATSNSLAVASGRVSFALGLHGPCASFETACSASLVACHHARRAVLAHDCQAALLAGVNLMFLPSTTQALSLIHI